jgi:hypothetical protein
VAPAGGAGSLPLEALASGVYADTWAAFERAAQIFGSRGEWARTLPTVLAAQDLAEVSGEGDVPFFAGASPMAEFWRLTWEQLRGGILKAGGGRTTWWRRSGSCLIPSSDSLALPSLPPRVAAPRIRRGS